MTENIVLIGKEDGVAEAAADVGAIHCDHVALDAFGTPLVNSAFEAAAGHASTRWMCYVNSDIILMPEFGEAVSRIISAFDKCLIVFRRWNLDVESPIQFDSEWSDRLRELASLHSQLFTPYGIDVFVFPKELFSKVPPFSVGRPYWDNWMISSVRQNGHVVIDATQPFSVLHQNHSYDACYPNEDIRRGQQGLRNFWLAGDSTFGLSHTDNATHYIHNGEVKEKDLKTVSVVIPHAGSYQQLRRCLAALSDQSYPRTFIEIIVVENSDRVANSPAALDYPFVIFTRETKPGPAAARNKGAAIAQGDIICFLDSDCLPAGDWIQRAVESAMTSNLENVVACNIEPWDPGYGVPGVRWYEKITYHDQKGYVEECQACITGGMLVPKRVWIKVGAFDESFQEAACEDWEWSTRATSTGVRIVYSHDAVVRHPVDTSWRALRAKAQRYSRGEILLARRRRAFHKLSVDYQVAAYSRRLRAELCSTWFHKTIPLRQKLSVALAACLVWYWSISEVKRQLMQLAYLISNNAKIRRKQAKPARRRTAAPSLEDEKLSTPVSG